MDRLWGYIAELDRVEDALRHAGRLPCKQPGKVIDLRPRVRRWCDAHLLEP